MDYKEKVYVGALTWLGTVGERHYVSQMRSVLAVYELGSRYAGYYTENSDYNYMVVYMPSPYDLMYPTTIHKQETEIDGNKVEVKYMSIVEYIHRIEEGDLEALQMLNAKDSQRLFSEVTETVDNKHTRLVNYMKELEIEREKFTYLAPEKLFREINGRIKSGEARMDKALEKGNTAEAVKCAILIRYFMDLLHVLENGEPIREGLTFSPMVSEYIRDFRANSQSGYAEIFIWSVESLLKEDRQAILNNLKNRELSDASARALRYHALTGRLLNVLLGGYYD
ncbi:hypothetical protein [Enterococcus phage vB_Efs25_KEN11]|uniref:Uncharacterized protein n=1 Tax=Enterococcus phage vB_Efs6_KEN16 TaxID=3138325 RepID=A0AAX4PTT3_9CAUD